MNGTTVLQTVGAPRPTPWHAALRRRWDRWRRWEFWPAWALYGPLLPALAWYALRHGGATVFTAANPGILHGGLAGESKWETLRRLPHDAVAPSILLPPGPTTTRRDALLAAERILGPYPIILKPDVGERGAGVRLVRSRPEALQALARTPAALIAQRYHPGPFEAGVFYIRRPGRPTGRIFSITDKQFPRATGDGQRTLRELIDAHPRLRLQAPVFLRRLGPAADRVPHAGESVPLAVAGNHCQGTMFLDGARLITPELTAAFDRIASAVPGFCFGRFDVRYADPDQFRAGRGFSIVELNGVGSESTNIYDPAAGFWQGQRVLREQWRLAYEIGAENIRRGARPTPALTLLRSALAHLRRPDRTAPAD